MAFDTKPNLSDNKFEQFSGETLSLSGLTDIYGEMQIKEEGVFDTFSGIHYSGQTFIIQKGDANPNIGIGYCTISAVEPTGTNNIGIGCRALECITTGDCNLAIGGNVLRSTSTVSGNIAVGYNVMPIITGSSGVNVGFGINILCCSDLAVISQNVGIGSSVLSNLTGGSGNVGIGSNALQVGKTGSNNVAIGIGSMYNNCGSNNIGIGPNTLRTNCGQINIGIGVSTMYNVGTGGYNIGMGYQTMCINTTGCRNVSIGPYSMQVNDTGACNVAVGMYALQDNQSGNANTALGYQAIINNVIGQNNVAIGPFASYFSTGSTGQISIGCNAQRCFCCGTGCNIGIGGNALLDNKSGGCNVAVGNAGTLGGIETGTLNTALGHCAGAGPTGSSSCSVFIGARAGSYALCNCDVSNSVFIGYCAGHLETNPNRLHIANGSTSLIYGEFDNKLLQVNGCMAITELPAKTSQTNVLYIDQTGALYSGATSGFTGSTGTASGERIVKEISQASHGFAVGDFVGWSGGTYNKAIADGNYDGEFIGLVSEVPDAGTFCVTQAGYVTGLTSLVANTTYWLSPTSEGDLTDTEPSTDGQVAKAVLAADSTTTGWVVPYPGFLVSSGSTAISTADNGLTDNGGIVELGGTLCQNTDIDVAGFNLSISGLSGKTTQEKAVFVDDATGTLVTGATTAGCGTYSSNSPSTCTVGGISSGTVLTGLTLEYILQEILAPYIVPTFSAFNISGTYPIEVGAALSGTKTFTWTTTTSGNVASNSIGICEVGGSLLGSGLADDGSEALDIGTKTNTSPTTWTWQVTGCSTQDDSFSRNVSKCSIYPYYWGVEPAGSRPAVTNDIVTGGTKCVAASTSTVTVDFNSSNEYTWLAIPQTSTSKTCWYVTALNNGNIGNPGDKYPDECIIAVCSAEGCWTGVNYKVYMSAVSATDADPIQFRNS